jgi:uncharacterized protein (UPF0128 family)
MLSTPAPYRPWPSTIANFGEALRDYKDMRFTGMGRFSF